MHGVHPSQVDWEIELRRQYRQAQEFLVSLANRHFGGDRSRVVVVPGNHDVCYPDVIASVSPVGATAGSAGLPQYSHELSETHSTLRWSWHDLSFFRVSDSTKYNARFRYFAEMFEEFYAGVRIYSQDPSQQVTLYDYPDLGVSVVGLNSCYNNDPYRRAGSIHPTAIASACDAMLSSSRDGWLKIAVWHHNCAGGPLQEDYVDPAFLQHLIDCGVSLGFHGHQHMHDCFDEKYRFGPSPRKITVISAGTLCAEPRSLRPGIPRSYNVVEVDEALWRGTVHQRQMINSMFNMPIWGPGHFSSTGRPQAEFSIDQPQRRRPAGLDTRLTLEKIDRLTAEARWDDVVDRVASVKDNEVARRYLANALEHLDSPPRTIKELWPPLTPQEAVILGNAILVDGTKEQATSFLSLEIVSTSSDASIAEIARRIRERVLR